MRELLIGMDLGTNGARTVVYDALGNIRGIGRSRGVEQTSEGWLQALMNAVPECLKVQTAKICSIASTSGTLVLADEFGRPVFAPMMYYEQASDDAVAALREICSEPSTMTDLGYDIRASTSPLAKLLDCKMHEPERFERVRWILSPATWLLYRMFFAERERWNELETDWSNALKFGATVTARPRWSSALFEALDINIERLPAVVRCGKHIGSAHSAFAAKLGLVNASLHQGLTDGNASSLAMGLLKPYDYGIACGTTSVVKYVVEELKPHPLLYYHRHPFVGYLASASFPTGKLLKECALDVCKTRIEDALQAAEGIAPEMEHEYCSPEVLSRIAASELEHIVLSKVREQMASHDYDTAHIMRSVASCIALLEYRYIPLLESLFAARIEKVRLLGGGAVAEDNVAYAVLDRIRAAVWARPVMRMAARTTAGVVMPAAVEAGVYEDVTAASAHLLRVIELVEPVAGLSARYEKQRIGVRKCQITFEKERR